MLFCVKERKCFLITHGRLKMWKEMSLHGLMTWTTQAYSFKANIQFKTIDLLTLHLAKATGKINVVFPVKIYSLFHFIPAFAPIFESFLLPSSSSLFSVLLVTLSSHLSHSRTRQQNVKWITNLGFVVPCLPRPEIQ